MSEYYKIKKETLDDIALAIGEKKGTIIPIDETSAGDNLAEEIRLLDMTDNLIRVCDGQAFDFENPKGTIKTVKNHVFYNHKGLRNIDLPECTSVGDNAFYGCSNLKRINLPKCKTVGSSAFVSAMKNVTEIDLSECTTLSTNAFSDTSVTVANIDELRLSNVTSIGGSAFQCIPVRKVYLDNYETYSIGALFGFDYVEEAYLPKLKNCGQGAFSHHATTGGTYTGNLKKVVFGSLTSIGYSSAGAGTNGAPFYNQRNLRLVDMRNQTAIPTASANVFSSSKNNMCYIVVPDNLVDDWRVATNWSKYHTGGTYGAYYTICTEAEYNAARASDSTLPELD